MTQVVVPEAVADGPATVTPYTVEETRNEYSFQNSNRLQLSNFQNLGYGSYCGSF